MGDWEEEGGQTNQEAKRTDCTWELMTKNVTNYGLSLQNCTKEQLGRSLTSALYDLIKSDSTQSRSLSANISEAGLL